jgi:hypothetical protein
MSDGSVHVSLVESRCRIAPLKQVSLPRLELEGALMAAKMSAVLRAELDLVISATTLWVDSQAVLKYISNESRRFHTFIANRVSVIQQVTEECQWRFVPGSLNPADLVSRGGDVCSVGEPRWASGPGFLLSPPSEWPNVQVSHDLVEVPEVN